MPANELGDSDGSTPTRPETPRALLERTVEQFSSAAQNIARAVLKLEQVTGHDRAYLAELLAEDIHEFLAAGRDLASYVKSRAR